MDTINRAGRRVPVPGLGELWSEACGPVDGPPVLLATSPDHRPYMTATMGRAAPGVGLPGPPPAFLQALLRMAVERNGPPGDVAVRGWSAFHAGSHPLPADMVRA
jgi:hypothetical protein